MKKIVFFTLCICLSLICRAQDSLSNETPAVIIDSATVASQGYSSMEGKEISKAEADSAYIKNDFASAIQLYESLLSQGVAADVYYNLGNSYYKTDNIAKAILNYERALLLEPGNGDIRANLEVARAKTIDKVEQAPELFFISWKNALVNCMSEQAWSISAITFFLLLIVSLYLFIFSKQVMVKKVGFFSSIVFFVLVVAANLFAAEQKDKLTNRNQAIIMNPSVTVHSTPSEGGTNLFVLHEGSKVKIKDNSMKGWKEIQLEDGKVGWVPAEALEII